MADPTVLRRRTATAVVLASAILLALGVGPAAATVAEDCGGGATELLHGTGFEIATITGVRFTGLDAACDGQPVGVLFLGNDAGDPDWPGEVLATAFSDEDPCTGFDDPSGVVSGGAVEVRLCQGASQAGFVDGAKLTRLELVTTSDFPTTPTTPTVDDPGTLGAPAPAPSPAAAPATPEKHANTGADPWAQAWIGLLTMLGGIVLVRLGGRLPTG